MKYVILAIGDELLAGQVTDTNSGAIARMLEPHGWELLRTEVIADTPEALTEALDRALARVDVVLTTGGLGPTNDDTTKQTLCRYFGGQLRHDPLVLANVERVVAARGLKLNELTAAQAIVPDCARIIQNEVGTAPLLWFERKGKAVVSMPGVPFETEQMMQRRVMPLLLERFPARESLLRHTIVVMGMSESSIAERLAPWEASLPGFAHLAYLPKPGVVRLRLDGRHSDGVTLKQEMLRLRRELIALLPLENIMATDDLTPSEALLLRLKTTGLSFGAAESCTGGLISQRITAIPGASECFRGSVTAYSNDVKAGLLGVNRNDLRSHGAVSQPVVEQMALGACRVLGCDMAVATSGIAGPGGGTAQKPVGTVWMAVACRGEVTSWMRRFPGTRDRVTDRAATEVVLAALRQLTALPKRFN